MIEEEKNLFKLVSLENIWAADEDAFFGVHDEAPNLEVRETEQVQELHTDGLNDDRCGTQKERHVVSNLSGRSPSISVAPFNIDIIPVSDAMPVQSIHHEVPVSQDPSGFSSSIQHIISAISCNLRADKTSTVAGYRRSTQRIDQHRHFVGSSSSYDRFEIRQTCAGDSESAAMRPGNSYCRIKCRVGSVRGIDLDLSFTADRPCARNLEVVTCRVGLRTFEIVD